MTVFIAQLKRENQVRYPRIKFLGKDFSFFFNFFLIIYIYTHYYIFFMTVLKFHFLGQ